MMLRSAVLLLAVGVVLAACGGGPDLQRGLPSAKPTTSQTPSGQTPQPTLLLTPTPVGTPTAERAWRTVDVAPGSVVWSISEDPATGRLWAGVGDDSGHGGTYRSDDGGDTWLYDSPRDGPATTVRVEPVSGDVFTFIEGTNGGLFQRDAGDVWRLISANLIGNLNSGPSTFAVAPGGDSFVWSNGDVYVSRRDADPFTFKFEHIPIFPITAPPEATNCHDVRDVAIVPSDPQWVYANSNRGGLIVSHDGGRTWPQTPEDCVYQFRGERQALAVDPTDPSTAYAGARGAIRKTKDGSSTHRTIPISTAGERAITAIAIDPTTPQRVYAAASDGYPAPETSSVFVSTDAGETWSKIADMAGVNDLLVDGEGTAYAATTAGVGISEAP